MINDGYPEMAVSAVFVVEYGDLIRQPADAKDRHYSHHHHHDLQVGTDGFSSHIERNPAAYNLT